MREFSRFKHSFPKKFRILTLNISTLYILYLYTCQPVNLAIRQFCRSSCKDMIIRWCQTSALSSNTVTSTCSALVMHNTSSHLSLCFDVADSFAPHHQGVLTLKNVRPAEMIGKNSHKNWSYSKDLPFSGCKGLELSGRPGKALSASCWKEAN